MKSTFFLCSQLIPCHTFHITLGLIVLIPQTAASFRWWWYGACKSSGILVGITVPQWGGVITQNQWQWSLGIQFSGSHNVRHDYHDLQLPMACNDSHHDDNLPIVHNFSTNTNRTRTLIIPSQHTILQPCLFLCICKWISLFGNNILQYALHKNEKWKW